MKKILFPEKEIAERYLLYGYDIVKSTSDIDITNSSSNNSDLSAET